MTFLVIVETGEITQVLASRTGLSETLIYLSEGRVGAVVVSSKPGLEFFSKESNKVGLFILNFLPLILGVLSNATPGGIYGSL